jgi:L-rhamnose mutarotase
MADAGEAKTDRYVLTIDLRDERGVVETYRRHHEQVWPEVVRSFRDAGVRELDIHLLGRRLVMILELPRGQDLRETFAMHAASHPRVAEWEQLMTTFQQPVAEARPGEWWALMEPICRIVPGADARDEDVSGAAGAAGAGAR